MRDLHNQVAVRHTLAPATHATTATGTTVDRRGFESVDHAVTLGASGDTLSPSVSITLKLEHSHDGSGWEAATDADALGPTLGAAGAFAVIDDTAEDGTTYRVGYVGGRRYSRVVAEFTGVHASGTPLAALALLGHAHMRPV